MRKSWDEYFMDIAKIVSSRATCPKRHVGAIIVKDKRIISTGYNGAPSSYPHCDDVGCSLGDSSQCTRTIHAEANALSFAPLTEIVGSTLFTTDFPCKNCADRLADFGVVRVVYEKPYKRTEEEVLRLFDMHHIIVKQLVSSSGAERRAVNSNVEGSNPS